MDSFDYDIRKALIELHCIDACFFHFAIELFDSSVEDLAKHVELLINISTYFGVELHR